MKPWKLSRKRPRNRLKMWLRKLQRKRPRNRPINKPKMLKKRLQRMRVSRRKLGLRSQSQE